MCMKRKLTRYDTIARMVSVSVSMVDVNTSSLPLSLSSHGSRMSLSLGLNLEMAEIRLVKFYDIQLPERMGEMC